MSQQSRGNLVESGISLQLLLKQPDHAGVGRPSLLGGFNSPFRIERGQRGENVTASFLHLILQIADTVEVADGTSIELLYLRMRPAQVMHDERAYTNDR